MITASIGSWMSQHDHYPWKNLLDDLYCDHLPASEIARRWKDGRYGGETDERIGRTVAYAIRTGVIVVNMFSALKSSDFLCRRLMFQPGTQNVAGGINVPVMGRPAFTAFPAPYSKRAHTFRTAGGDSPAARARLGSPSFVNIDIHSLPSGSFIPQHVPKARPSSIKDGLRHSCSRQFGRAYVADRYKSVFPSNPRRLLVKVMTSGVRDFRVDSPDALFVSGTLRDSKLRLIFSKMSHGGNLVAVGHCRHIFEAKINADNALLTRKIVAYHTCESYIPAATGIFDKSPGSILAFNLARLPEGISLPFKEGSAPVYFYRARDKRHPSKRLLSAVAGAEFRAAVMLVTGFSKLAANLRDYIAMQTQKFATPSSQFYQIEGSWPAGVTSSSIATLCLTLCRNAKIPNAISGARLSRKAALTALDAEFESKNAQFSSCLTAPGWFKSASSDCRPMARSRFVSWPLINFNG